MFIGRDCYSPYLYDGRKKKNRKNYRVAPSLYLHVAPFLGIFIPDADIQQIDSRMSPFIRDDEFEGTGKVGWTPWKIAVTTLGAVVASVAIIVVVTIITMRRRQSNVAVLGGRWGSLEHGQRQVQVSPEAELGPVIHNNNEAVVPSAHDEQQQVGYDQPNSRENGLKYGVGDDEQIEATGADETSDIDPDGERRAPTVIDDKGDISPMAGVPQ